jgi:hypothetical protein
MHYTVTGNKVYYTNYIYTGNVHSRTHTNFLKRSIHTLKNHACAIKIHYLVVKVYIHLKA